MLVIILSEGREVPPFSRHQTIRKSGDILPCLLGNGKIRNSRSGIHIRTVTALENRQYMAQCKGLRPAETIINLERPIPVLILRFIVLVRLLSF